MQETAIIQRCRASFAPDYAHDRFPTAALSAAERAALSLQKQCFDKAKGLLSAAERAAFGKSKQPFQLMKAALLKSGRSAVGKEKRRLCG